ncbi:MAG: tetratricopeptide repeat protein [Saprospiraceae bacterium]
MKILPFLLLAFPLSAQITQHGLVLLQNSGRKPLSEVELTALGANPAISLANGAFSLTFGAKNKGDYAAIYAKKPGYEVVNQEELRKTGLHPTDTVRVLMCLAGELDRRRLAYYQINEKNITRSYNDKIAQLRAENRATDEALSKLGEDYQSALRQLEDYNERFIVMNLDEVSGLRKQAFALFERGQIDSAIAVLQDELITEDLNRARREKKQGQALKELGEQKIKNGEEGEKQAVQAWMDKAEFYVVKLDFAQAESYYEKAVAADTNNFDNVFKYAFFLQGQRQFAKVEQQYRRALALAGDSAVQALVLNNLGVFYSDNQRMAEAENAYLKALAIRRSLAQKNPDAYQLEVAASLNNLGVFYRDNNNMAEAEKAYSEALSIRRQLARENPDAFEAELAASLDNLGAFYTVNQKMADAEKAITEALAIRRKLVLKKGAAYQADLGKTLNSLGNFYRANQRAGEAEKAYLEALAIYRGLAQKNAVFQREVALCLNNLGILYRNNSDMAAAGDAFAESLNIRRMRLRPAFTPKLT